ncbi:MAG TPA: ABC transporter permease [Vicinamibacterales bacterium]|nr:ABC transporter permease [Vicinamibacterales bacterium]
MATTPATAPPPAREHRAPGLLYAALRVFDLSLGEMLWSRRTVFMALVVGLPVFIAIVIRLFAAAGLPMGRANGVSLTGPIIFGLMIWLMFVRFCVPVLAVFYGTSLIADEVEDKTITYLFSRPIPREAVLLGKYLAYLACTIFVVLPAVILMWLLIVPIGGTLGAGFIDLLKDLVVLALGLVVYGAVFALAGARLKRPLLIGLIFVFGWENFAMAVPGNLKRLTVAYYLQGLVPHAMPNDSAVSLLQSIFLTNPGLGESLFWLAVIEVVCLGLAARSVARREYVLEQ